MTTHLRAILLSSLCLTGALSGCGGSSSKSGGGGNAGQPPSFATVVVIGDSLSAGFQNGALLDTQQPNGWASLVATQAKFNLPLPLLAPPGVPAVLELVSVGPPAVTQQVSGTSSGRDDSSVQPYDLAVPGHKLNDLINAAPTLLPTTAEDIITNLVLGLPLGNNKTQLDEAVALNPTTLFLWIGSNDALDADSSGKPSSMTDVATFTTQYTQLLKTLHTKTKATLIVANIPDVTAIPYLTPADTVISEFATATGLPPAQAGAALGIQSGDLVNATGLSQVKDAADALKKGETPTPLDDGGFLTAAEIAQVQATTDQYNTVIQQQVSAVGGTLVDMHAFFQKLDQNGITLNGYTATSGFLGGLFSLDGDHPTNTAYALIANQFIDTMNTNLKTSIPDVDAAGVAKVDPLFGPNIKPVGTPASIPLNAARQTDRMIQGARIRP